MKGTLVIHQVYAAIGIHQHQSVGLIAIGHIADVDPSKTVQAIQCLHLSIGRVIHKQIAIAERIHTVVHQNIAGGLPVRGVHLPPANGLWQGRERQAQESQHQQNPFHIYIN